MESLAQLHDDHEALDAQLSRFEALLSQRQPARTTAAEERHKASIELERLLDQLSDRLSRHISFEEVHFYAPLKASGHANDDLMAILSSEHDDLLKTLEQLQQLRHRGRSATEEEWAVYGAHLIEVYREHAEREHRWLFPLLEQPPRGAAARWDPRITKETTLNAMIKGFPELLGVLHTFHLDCRWFGTQTLEEAAWYHGLPVEDLLGALNQSIAARRARRVPSCGGGDSGKRVDVGCVRGLPRERN